MNETIIEQCKAGNPFAQKLIYEQFVNQMYRLCKRYIRYTPDAEEMLMNGFLKVFKNIEKFEFRGEISLEVWMKKIMVNECLMHLRKADNFQFVAETEIDFQEQDYMNINYSTEELYAMILKLPVGYRTVFNLYAIEGYSHKEIAEQLGISENTSKSQLHKARFFLQQLIGAKNKVIL
jgi:RNA polymerase sigma-70 factor (ECF subfamily)